MADNNLIPIGDAMVDPEKVREALAKHDANQVTVTTCERLTLEVKPNLQIPGFPHIRIRVSDDIPRRVLDSEGFITVGTGGRSGTIGALIQALENLLK